MGKNPWKNAESVADLGHAMADWLEGRIPTWPGYGDTTTDQETRHLIPTLTACNRAGYVTTCSQPGEPPTRGWDGRTYRQRAAVEGWITDIKLYDRICSAAGRAGIVVASTRAGQRSGPGVICTEADGKPVTDFGWSPGHRRLIASEWPGVGRHAIRELRTATHLTLIDPQWGRDNLLWPMLDKAAGR